MWKCNGYLQNIITRSQLKLQLYTNCILHGSFEGGSQHNSFHTQRSNSKRMIKDGVVLPLYQNSYLKYSCFRKEKKIVLKIKEAKLVLANHDVLPKYTFKRG